MDKTMQIKISEGSLLVLAGASFRLDLQALSEKFPLLPVRGRYAQILRNC
jgi:hypothetical protein